MALVKCPICSADISGDISICPKCEESVKKPGKPNGKYGLFGMIAGAIVTAVIILSIGC